MAPAVLHFGDVRNRYDCHLLPAAVFAEACDHVIPYDKHLKTLQRFLQVLCVCAAHMYACMLHVCARACVCVICMCLHVYACVRACACVCA